MALTPAQLAVLKAAILAETDPGFVALRTAGSTGGMAAFYNAIATPAFIVWKPSVTIAETGAAFNGAEWAGMTSANHTRLQTVAQWMGGDKATSGGYNAAAADIRAMFNDIWSGAGGAITRANLLALWKRSASRAEKLFATGTGSDAVPATLTVIGTITGDDVGAALAL